MATIGHREMGARSGVPPRSSSRPGFGVGGERLIQSRYDVITVLLLLFPLYGMFYPLESYLGVRTEKGIGSLGFPFTPIALVAITVCVGVFYRKIIETRPFQHDYLIYTFIGVAFLSTAWSWEPMFTFQRALRLIPSIGLGLVFAQYYSTRRMMQLIALAFFISGPISVMVPIVMPDLGLSRLGNGYEGAWRGAHVHKNFAGFLYTFGLIFMIYAWKWNYIPRWLAMCCITTALIMSVMAQSATALVSMVVALTVGYIFSMVRLAPRELRLLVLTSMLLTTVVVGLAIALNLEFIVGLTGRDLTLTGRTQIWAAVWAEIQKSPILGQTYGFWSMGHNDVRLQMWKVIGDEAAHSHNSWLDICFQLGLVGFVPFMLMTFITIWRAFKLLVITNDKEVILIISLLTYILLRSFSEVQFTDPAIFQLFWLVWQSATLREMDLEQKRLPRGIVPQNWIGHMVPTNASLPPAMARGRSA